MTKRQKHKRTAYQVLVEPQAHTQRRKLPGHVRQRIRQTIVLWLITHVHTTAERWIFQSWKTKQMCLQGSSYGVSA
jgi:hypothetical protein